MTSRDIQSTSRLRGLLAAKTCHAVPETPDGLMARMVSQAGFDLAFISVMGTVLNRIGSPDPDLLTATELVDNALRCIEVSGLPTIVEAADGFGNPINVRRTVTELRRGGAAGVLLHDGALPRAQREARESIPIADMAAKLRAARDAIEGSDVVLIAGIEGAMGSASTADVAGRALRYREAGAELVHVGTLHEHARAVELGRALDGLALTCCLDPHGALDAAALAPLGFRLAFFPHCGLMAAIPAIEHTFAELARTGTVGPLRPHIADFRRFTDIAGLPGIQQLEDRYGVPDEQRTAL